MAKIFTPIQSVAAAGLLKNQGLGVSANLTTVVDQFNNSEYVDLCHRVLASDPAPEVRDAVTSLPSFLTGIVNANLRNTVPTDMNDQFDYSNLIGDILSQGNLVVSSGSLGLVDVLPQIKLYCQNSFNLMGTFAQMQTTTYRDFGMTISNYQDMLTGGVSNQYRNVAGGVDSQLEIPTGTINTGYAALANQLGNFGTMYDIRLLSKLDDPRTLCQNLLSQGFYLINQALVNAGVNVSNLANENTRLVLSALETIKGSELRTILSVTKFVPFKSLDTLADVLDISKIMSPAAVAAAGGSLSQLSRKLVNIGGTFASFADLKATYSSIQTLDLPNLSTLPSLGNVELFSGATDKLGVGSGIFGNPVVSDVIGSAAGIGYVDVIADIIFIHTQILSSALGQNLKNAIKAAELQPNNSTVAATIVSTRDTLLVSPLLSSLIQNGTDKFAELFGRLLNERKNIAISSIQLEESSGSVQGVAAFVSDLHNINKDPSNIKYADVVKNITTGDVYGEAIRACIVEGHNIAQLNDRNIPSYTKLDPVEYATLVLSQRHCE